MLFVKNSVLMFNFFCFDAWILISNEESDENNVWFGYDIQNTCGFHLGFHWVSKLMHVTNLAIFYWLSNVWIINEFEKHIWMAFQSKEGWRVPFWNIFFLEILTFLYYANKEIDDVIGGSSKTVQHSIKNISKLKRCSLNFAPEEMYTIKET